MISLEIPDFGKLTLNHIVLDYNGTIVVDGKLLVGVAERLRILADQIEIHVPTADTFGTVAAEAALAAGIFHREEVPIEAVKRHMRERGIETR